MRIQFKTIAAGAAALIVSMMSPAFARPQDVPSASARSEQTEAILSPGSTIFAELNSGLDSKKLSPGDKVSAHTTEPLKSADSRTLKDGTDIALDVVIQAMAPRQFSGPVGGGDDDSSPQHIGTNQTSPMSGSHGTPTGTSPQSADGGAGPGNLPAAPGPRLDERSRGAVGMKGVSLDAQTVSGRGATIVSSNGKSVKLDEGTRLLLVVQEKKGEAPPQ